MKSNGAMFYMQFKNVACVMPFEALSFCDFFGGVFSICVTLITAAALPARKAEALSVITVLVLTLTLHSYRFTWGLYTIPLVIGSCVVFTSWAYWSIRLRRLFPPVQWWILGLIPGVVCSSIALVIFLAPSNPNDRNYPIFHSIWHMLIGFSLACKSCLSTLVQ
ncbi:Transmembrane protein 8B [Cichlidogyrus casuarinus]|uniref:Transmembrane protein 8B n=1 Tax=Cichlidogyrus casuarinus TaxID=1844966 RepID=A0ABD2Q5K6_9PLAT